LSITTAIVFCVVGLVGLTFGAEWLVRGASRIATSLGVSPLVIGLTVVAYGTSAPEIIASVIAALQGHPEVTLGNVIGSNIANIGLILGLTALVTPFAVALQLMRRELPIMIVVTLVFFGLAWRLEYDRWVGTFFLLVMVLFTWLSLRWARQESRAVQNEFASFEDAAGMRKGVSLKKDVGLTVAGLAVLFVGGHLLVTGAVTVAKAAGLSDVIIGITLVAVGTSLPELATSVVAARRGEADIMVGNLVGSNLFNILGALAISAVIRPVAVNPALLRFEFPALLVFTFAMAAVLFIGKRVARWEGGILLAAYAVFIALLFLR
jgi:cation:H+ antiporter